MWSIFGIWKEGKRTKKILEGTIETVTLFTCYKVKLYFSKYEKGTPNEEFKTTEKYVYDQVSNFWKWQRNSVLKI